jgi:hypothetical protein
MAEAFDLRPTFASVHYGVGKDFHFSKPFGCGRNPSKPE